MGIRNGRAAAGAGHLLDMIRNKRARTRSELVRASGMARATVENRLTGLLEAGYIVYGAGSPGSASVGRPAEVFEFNQRSGTVLAADLGLDHCRVAVTDLDAGILASAGGPVDMDAGPKQVMREVDRHFTAVLEQSGAAAGDVRAIAVAVPGLVETTTGRVNSPTMMGKWYEFDLNAFFAQRFAEVPVHLENGAHVMALGEQRKRWPDTADLLMVDAGMSVGSGLVLDGRLFRGSLGAAGDIGHLNRGGSRVCRCGSIGCLETEAAGWAIARDLRSMDREARTAADIVALTRRGDPDAVGLVRQAGRVIGSVVADLVGVLNPSVVAVGGALAEARETLLAGIREAVYAGSHPLATRDLRITHSLLGTDAALIGAATLASEQLLAPEAIDAQLSNR
ncbi:MULTISPECIES: ROK family protein [unclassified Streptomyces]|uniref:ROK family protein n=1 Tax=unclassified Streptomyces TaxID=2593676 RepID=UPI0013E0C5EB|nr:MULTISPECIES: ROK family protein [unclassified Streptomyces]